MASLPDHPRYPGAMRRVADALRNGASWTDTAGQLGRAAIGALGLYAVACGVMLLDGCDRGDARRGPHSVATAFSGPDGAGSPTRRSATLLRPFTTLLEIAARIDRRG